MVAAAARRVRDDLVEGLLLGRGRDNADAGRWAAHLGYDATRPHQVASIAFELPPARAGDADALRQRIRESIEHFMTTRAPEAIVSAREAARTAPTLEALRQLLENFDGCALKSTATRLVFADGNPQARIMFVGEAPGREEDLEGLPFVGRSGKLLDRMIAAIGLDRSSAYIANVIPWRPPGNRTPTPQETQICLPFIQRQIELVNPDVLVTLGNPSTQTLLGTREGIMKTRGRWFDYDTGTRTIRALATFHPAYLLRSPSYKRMSWQDLRAIAKALAPPSS